MTVIYNEEGKPTIDPRITEARILATQGLTNTDIAKHLGVHVSTIGRWFSQLPPLPPLPEDPEERVKALGGYIEMESLEIVVACLQQIRKDIHKKKFTPKYNPNTIAGTLLDKLIKLRLADRMAYGGMGNQTQINIFTDIDKIESTIDKVMENVLDPAVALEGNVHQDDTPEPLYPGGPQAAPEAGGIPAGDRPEDG